MQPREAAAPRDHATRLSLAPGCRIDVINVISTSEAEEACQPEKADPTPIHAILSIVRHSGLRHRICRLLGACAAW